MEAKSTTRTLPPIPGIPDQTKNPRVAGKTVGQPAPTELSPLGGEPITEKLAAVIRSYPAVSLGVALAIGGMAAWIIKRRI